jgi:glycosyltransferase involved in cell wall biosynthesis
MQAISEMGIDFDLTTLKSPDLSKLEKAYGKNFCSVMENINKIKVVNILDELQRLQSHEDYDYDITINTHADSAPYYHRSLSKNNAITYCHYPDAKRHIESENMGYLERDIGITISSNVSSYNNNIAYSSKNFGDADNLLSLEKECFRILKYGYWNLMRNSTVLTNSEFSSRAIFDAFGIDNTHILSPPIDIDTFRNDELMSKGHDYEKNDIILVISRIDPYKQIENAINLAKILKNKNIGIGMKIVGNLYYYDFDCYSHLKQMVIDLGLTDYVTFEINASLDKLLSIMGQSKVYFHPARGEHFGMAVVEAMAAGLIPIVPNKGGPTEFVPKEYHFNTLEQAAEIISSAFHLPSSKRLQMSNSVNKFSTCHYIKRFQHIVNGLLSNS